MIKSCTTELAFLRDIDEALGSLCSSFDVPK